MSAIIFIVVLFILILVHEYGHFFVARKFGIWVEEFAIGFPPKLFAKKIKDTIFSFNIIPLGGFVKIFGENPEDPEFLNSDKKNQGFISKPKYAQALVLLGGIIFNILFAWFLLSISFFSGVPASVSEGNSKVSNAKLTVLGVLPNSPAAHGEIRPGDIIVSAQAPSGEKISKEEMSPSKLQSFVATHSKETLEILVLRENTESTLFLKPDILKSGEKPAIGISMDMIGTLRLPLHKAIFEGAKSTYKMIGGTAKAFVQLIGNSVQGKAKLESLTGPIGIAGAVGDASRFGFTYLISFAALISINLAVFNLVPFPALDGGRLLFLLIETIIRKPLNQKIVGYVNFAGFVFLIGLMLLISYHDIVKIF